MPVRPFGSTTALPVCAGGGRFIASDPLHFHYPVRPAALTVSTPLRDFCLPRDQSVQPRLPPAGPPDESARFPLAPRRPSWLKFGLRITVPGPLRFRRLAVPQTSWNLIHYAPVGPSASIDFSSVTNFFLRIYLACFQTLSNNIRGGRVDKTKLCCPVLAE